ncbi:TonB-dependent receptor plug domain-containing protein [Sphingobium sp.]|uniref:TonB-dependent receptor plug domain-containing protein n=1 Tax=Sphingobium sp. TaxID=1912891 RepID=UPI0028BD5ABE|nr:TonB-dependent receptor [Sphingobium sp.]
MTKFRFAACSSVFALSLACATAGLAQTQTTAATDDAESEEIIVTGSSIKGVAPVGSNLVTVGRQDLESTGAQTVQQVLKSVPSVVGLQSAGQGAFGSADGSGTNAPTIHGLGASASNSTLVLMNGHRIPTSGINHVLADPNIIAPLALERVEVLADGASSVYGSDAVAGVINFITRRNYNGAEVTAQKGFGDSYNSFTAGALWGHTFDTGSILLAYNYSNRSALSSASRSYFRSDLRAFGGTNQTPTRCTTLPTTTTGTATGCDPTGTWDVLPSERRHNVYAQFTKDFGDKLHFYSDFVYSNRRNVQNVSRGGASGTIYAFAPSGTGTTPLPAGRSVNPYAIAALASATTGGYTVNWDADAMFGPGATIAGTAEDTYFHADFTYDLTPAWQVNLGGIYGIDTSTQTNQGQLNASTFNLALNGFASAAINGATQSVTQALTTANAIDLYGSGTSAATKAGLIDNRQFQYAHQTIANAYAKVSGDLVELPAGAAKLAVGGELVRYRMDQYNIRANNLGPASAASQAFNANYKREVQSAYAELYIPLVKGSVFELLDLNISGRYDHYSDFGSTTNPKIAANFEPIRGIRFRGNWAKSFVAPALTSIGSNASGLTGESGFSGIVPAGIPGGSPTILIANFPAITQLAALGVASCGTTSCTLKSSTNGVLVQGGNSQLKPQRGTAWSVGVDITPVQVPGLRLSATYWNNKLRGGITAPQAPLALGSADLSYLLQLYPAGATGAQIAALGAGLPQTGVINSPVYFSYNFQQQNILNLDVAGLDVSANYRFDTGIGRFNLGGSFTRKLKFDQFFGANGTKFSVLGTSGFNTTFPSVKFEGRFNVGFESGGFSGDVFVNHLGSYKYWGSSVVNALVRTNGVPTSGGDDVKAFTTVDLHLGYTFKNLAGLNEAQVYVDATNMFDKAPPFVNVFNVNGSVGYDNLNANPLGRIVNIGLRTKF